MELAVVAAEAEGFLGFLGAVFSLFCPARPRRKMVGRRERVVRIESGVPSISRHGSCTVKVDPLPTSLSAQMRP